LRATAAQLPSSGLAWGKDQLPDPFAPGPAEEESIPLVVFSYETRTVHIDDDNQADHSLRRSTHDGAAGDRLATADARAALHANLERARAGGKTVARWSFPFYGEVDVRAVSVCNFVDAVRGVSKERRDGLPHSDALDTCDPQDPLEAVLDLRPGCTMDNDDCDSPYLERAREGQSEPIRLWFCHARPASGPSAWWLLLLILRRRRS